MEGPPDGDMTEWASSIVNPGSPPPGDLHTGGDSTVGSSLGPGNPAGEHPAAAGDAPGSLGSRDGGGPFAGMLGIQTSPDCEGFQGLAGTVAAAAAGAGGAVEDLSRAPSTDSGSPGLDLGHLCLGSPQAGLYHSSPQPAMGSMLLAPQQQLVQQQQLQLAAGSPHASSGAVPLPLGQLDGALADPGHAVSDALWQRVAGLTPQQQEALLLWLNTGGANQQLAMGGVALQMPPVAGGGLGLPNTNAGPVLAQAAAAADLPGAGPMVVAAAAAAAAAAPPPPPPPVPGGRCILLPADLGSLAAQLEAQLLQLQPSTEQHITAAKDVQMVYTGMDGNLQQVSVQEAAVACLVGLQQWQMAEAAAQGWQPPPGVLAAAGTYHDLLLGITPQAIDWAPKEAPEQPTLWWVPSSNGRRDTAQYAPRNCSYTSHTARIIKGDEARNICRVVGQIRVLDPQQQQAAQDTVLYLVPVQVGGGLEGFQLGLRVDGSGMPLQASTAELERYPRLHCAALPFSEDDNNWGSFFRGPSSSVWRYGRVMGLLDMRCRQG